MQDAEAVTEWMVEWTGDSEGRTGGILVQPLWQNFKYSIAEMFKLARKSLEKFPIALTESWLKYQEVSGLGMMNSRLSHFQASGKAAPSHGDCQGTPCHHHNVTCLHITHHQLPWL